ncbi:MAG: DVUA0089 family protein, partial [Chthoniobacterales bacterium]|nr:DVUA0089 family protein [Chthoniobacterales bacterium]
MLAAAGLAHVLHDPMLQLWDATGALLTHNNDWRESQEAEVLATGLAPSDKREAAFVTTLLPGAYTVGVTGLNGGT